MEDGRSGCHGRQRSQPLETNELAEARLFAATGGTPVFLIRPTFASHRIRLSGNHL